MKTLIEDIVMERISQIVEEIVRERIVQDQQWGGGSHDDKHDQHDWCEYISYQADYVSDNITAVAFEERMVKIAALAVAAVQSSRRKRGA